MRKRAPKSGPSERGRVGALRQSVGCGHFRAGGEEPHGLAPVTGLTRGPIWDQLGWYRETFAPMRWRRFFFLPGGRK